MHPQLLKRLAAVLIGLWILLTGLTILSRRKPQAPTLLSKEAKPVKVEISSAKQSLLFVQKERDWRMEKPFSHPANGVSIEDLIGKLKTSPLGEILTERSSQHSLFQVDASSGIRLRFFQAPPAPLLDLWIGKTASEYDSTFVRKEGFNEVREAKNFSRYLADREVSEWLEKKFFSESAESVLEFGIRHPAWTLAFEKKDGSWRWAGDKSLILSTSTLQGKAEPLLQSLLSLEADRVLSPEESKSKKEKETSLNRPEWILTIRMENQKTFRVEMGKTDASGQRYVRLPGRDVLYLISSWKLDSLQKTKKDFL